VSVVEVVRGEGVLSVGRCWTYVWRGATRPFLHPVATPAGRVLTRDAPPDHPWHHGLWFAVKFVNGENFWEEYGEFGVVRPEGEPSVEAHGDRVRVAHRLVWVRPDGRSTALVEDRVLTHVPLGSPVGDAYAIDVDVTLVPPVDTVLDRTPFTTWGGYGGLTLRGPGDWSDTRLLLADGTVHDRVLGIRSPWCDLTGSVGADGALAGVAVLDHPANPWYPVPWYASTRADTYGGQEWSNFLNAAFLWYGPREVPAGTPLRVRHRVIVHDGPADRDGLRACARAYAAAGGSPGAGHRDTDRG
jgi:hypothetical protein